MRAAGFLLSALVAASCGLSVSAAEPTSEAEGEMAAIYLKMGIAENVFAEAGKLAGTNAAVSGEIGRRRRSSVRTSLATPAVG